MTLRIKHKKLRLAIWLPNCLLGSIVKSVIRHESEKKDRAVTLNAVDGATIGKLVKALRKAKKVHKKLEIVSVKAADGTMVRIVL